MSAVMRHTHRTIPPELEAAGSPRYTGKTEAEKARLIRAEVQMISRFMRSEYTAVAWRCHVCGEVVSTIGKCRTPGCLDLGGLIMANTKKVVLSPQCAAILSGPMPSLHTCPRCKARTAAPDCCGVVFARRRRWRMTAAMVSRVHALALGQKGLNYETYRLRLQAVGVKSSKNFSRAQYAAFMRGLATLPDVAPRRVSAAQMGQGGGGVKVPRFLISYLVNRLVLTAIGTDPDFIVGGADDPYLKRWFVLPWSRWCHHWRRTPEESWTLWQRFVMRWPVIYLHQFLRSDDDRALHDHPWANCSILLHGRYAEHTIAAGGVHLRTVRQAGDMAFRWARAAHRVELLPDPVYIGEGKQWIRTWAGSPTIQPCWSLFITGFRLREWYFHCPERGLVHWRKFTAADDRGAVGKGCEA